MRLSIISFTEAGLRLSKRIGRALRGEMEVRIYTKCSACGAADGKTDFPATADSGCSTSAPAAAPDSGASLPAAVPDSGVSVPAADPDSGVSVLAEEISLGTWTGRQMGERNALLFIGACGIAVRAIAPFVADKMQDAPVLVMDERGAHVIPLLSGHVGGANELAHMLAERTGAEAVITTATDIRGKFAVDVFAKKNGLFVERKENIAKISSKVLAGKEIRASVETGHGGGMLGREGVHIVPYPPEESVDIVVTSERKTYDAAMILHPKEYVFGIGCKKGKGAEEIGRFIAERLAGHRILITQIFALASIAQKGGEEGILRWCEKENIPFLTYSAEKLWEAEGNFTKSDFVMEQVGVDNVCERSALCACGPGGKLIAPKCAKDGMTIAIAKRDWKI